MWAIAINKACNALHWLSISQAIPIVLTACRLCSNGNLGVANGVGNGNFLVSQPTLPPTPPAGWISNRGI
jgi:hypothetical protein